MAQEVIPGLEKGTDSLGQIACDLDNLHQIEINLDNQEFKNVDIEKKSVSDFGNEGFLLRHVLTEKESQLIIELGEQSGFEEIRVKESYRNSQRITLDNPKLASILYERISSHLEDITIADDPHKNHIHGIPFVLKGKWKPSGLNPIFRLCRYQPGGHFAPHFDGHYVKDSNERSLKTFMLYLNSDFNGGSTNFINDKQKLYKDESGKYCAEGENIICRVQPETGMAILFNHHRLHEGEQVNGNKKYILRTDIMYTKEDGDRLTENEEKGLILLQEAERLEAQHQEMKAVDCYRKAYKLCPELEFC